MNAQTTTAQVITREVRNNTMYLSTMFKGSTYTLRFANAGWELTTRRMNFGGPQHMGGCKRFATLADVKASCKAFAPIDLLDAL